MGGQIIQLKDHRLYINLIKFDDDIEVNQSVSLSTILVTTDNYINYNNLDNDD